MVECERPALFDQARDFYGGDYPPAQLVESLAKALQVACGLQEPVTAHTRKTMVPARFFRGLRNRIGLGCRPAVSSRGPRRQKTSRGSVLRIPGQADLEQARTPRDTFPRRFGSFVGC